MNADFVAVTHQASNFCASIGNYMIRAYRGRWPKIAPSAYIDPSAQVIGAVTVGERSSIWPNVTARGDVNAIRIGDETNIQDNCVLHCEPSLPLTIGNRVSVEYRSVVHGCIVEDDCLIGRGAIVLNGSRIGRGSIVEPGTVVTEGAQVPPQSLVSGLPGKIVRQITDEERKHASEHSKRYVETAKVYKAEPA
jgi:carbonic anhydrase/acetyltransferase-like protein (isoleucine patch superfamily)